MIEILRIKRKTIFKDFLRLQTIKYGSPEYCRQQYYRLKYLRIPLGISNFTKEELTQEKNDIFVGLFYQQLMIGGLIFVKKDPSTWKMRQVWIKTQYQKQGLGTFMIIEAEKLAQQFQIKKIKANARKYALNLYERLNYKICSEEFIEVGIPHFQIVKHLDQIQLFQGVQFY